MTLIFDPETHQLVTAKLLYAARVLRRPLVPRTYTARVTFDTAAAGAMLPCQLEERVPDDTWIRTVEYTIRQPTMFGGNILKPQRDYFFQKGSAFEVECESIGGPPSQCIKVTADGPVPLESFAQPAGEGDAAYRNPFGAYFILAEDMNLRFKISTVEALSGDEIPTEVILTLKVLQIDGCPLKTVDADTAMQWFEKMLDREQG